MKEPSDEETTIEQLKKEIEKFGEERDWFKYHTPKNLAISISIEAAELLENFQWLGDEEIEKILKDDKKRKKIEKELADVITYALNLSNILKIDVSKAVLDKIRENEKKYPIDKIKGNYIKYSQIK